MRLTGLFGTLIHCFFVLAACGTIADAADPDTAYRSPDAAIIQDRIIPNAMGDLLRADASPSPLYRHTVPTADDTGSPLTITFSLIGGANPEPRLSRLITVYSADRDRPQTILAPIFSFRRDRAHRIRDGGDLHVPSFCPLMGETAPYPQGGFSCPRRTA